MSTSPARFISGLTNAMAWQPLGNLGLPDPFFYACYDDDFLPYNAANYTVTASGGSVAATPGSGGQILLTTGATAGNFASLQSPVAGFSYTAGLRLAYLCRLQVTNVATAAFVAGLIETTATPFGTITDGIYFSLSAGSANLVLNATKGSTVLGSVSIPLPMANATFIDLGFYTDRLGNIQIFYGSNLEGKKTSQNAALLGPMAVLPASNLSGSLTSANLNPTIAISNGTTAAAMTGIADFQFAGMER